MSSYYVVKLCVYQLKEMNGFGSAIRVIDADQSPPVLPDMDFDFSVYVFDQSLRPIGVNMKEYYMDHRNAWPYYINKYQLEFNPVDVKDQENRQRFIAYTNRVDNTIPLYLYQAQTGAFYLSLKDKVSDDLSPAFNPAIYVMPTPFSRFKCIQGIVAPTEEESGQPVYKVLEMCRVETGQEMIKSTIQNVSVHDSGGISNLYSLLVISGVLIAIVISFSV